MKGKMSHTANDCQSKSMVEYGDVLVSPAFFLVALLFVVLMQIYLLPIMVLEGSGQRRRIYLHFGKEISYYCTARR